MKAICSDCQQPCECKIIDEGIGHYEYWGFVGYDSRPTLVSNCCQAECLDELGDLISIHDYQQWLQSEQSYYED